MCPLLLSVLGPPLAQYNVLFAAVSINPVVLRRPRFLGPCLSWNPFAVIKQDDQKVSWERKGSFSSHIHIAVSY